jgi:hypothetical protein
MQYQHSVDGKLLRTWNGHQINDLALTADGRFLLATPSNGNMARVAKQSIDPRRTNGISTSYGPAGLAGVVALLCVRV